MTKFPQTVNTRPGLPLSAEANELGPLADLGGTWIGRGMNLIALPDFSAHPPKPFRLQLNATQEILQFTPIGAPVPNRGSVTALNPHAGQADLNIYGLNYFQRVSDSVTNEPLHIEPGTWINVPQTKVAPLQDATIVRMAAIPHGVSLLAQGPVTPSAASGPTIDAIDSNPKGPGMDRGYTNPYFDGPLPPGIQRSWVHNPNLALLAAIHGQTIAKTVTLTVSTTPSGGIVNIPYLVSNANVTRVDATFWIETVHQPNGDFLQLQYSQNVILNFLGIDWPHISVATLVKQ